MRTLQLLIFACVVVTESKAGNNKTRLLRECIDSAKYILHNSSNEVLNQWVQDVFTMQACSEESICLAAKALEYQHLNTQIGLLWRQLYAYAKYTGHRTCTVADTVEYGMKEFLKSLITCCKKLIQHKKHR